MSDFDRLEKIFGINSANKTPKPTPTPKRKRRSNQSANVAKIKQPRRNYEDEDVFQLSISRIQKSPTNKSLNNSINFSPAFGRLKELPVDESPDKNDILPYLSCNINQFDENLEPEEKNIENEQLRSEPRNDFMTRLQQEIFSPEIEDFTESDDIFNRSIEGERIAHINNDIAEIHQKKSKYKPINKNPKPGGLMERLRGLIAKRAKHGCDYASNLRSFDNEKKIKILQHTPFRRRLLLKFEFEDEPVTMNVKHNYLAVPLEYQNFIANHEFYDVVLDLSARESLKNHFVHYGKLVKASRVF